MDGHLMLRRLAFVFGALSLLVIASYILAMPTTLTIAVGPIDSVQTAYVETIRKAMKDTRQPFRLRLVRVDGSRDASRALDSGQVDLAVLRSDDLTSSEARSIVLLQKRSVIMVARKDSGITNFTDLHGKRIGLLATDSESYRPLIERLMGHYEIPNPKGDLLQEYGTDAVLDAVEADQIDALIMVANPAARTPRRLIGEISGRLGIPIVISGMPAAEALAFRFRELHTSEIPEGVFGGTPAKPEADLDSVAVSYELVAPSSMLETRATALTKSLMELRTRLRRDQESSFYVETPPVDTPRRFLPHAGTDAYVNNEAKTLLETYSDELWLALFALSLVGSSVTGFFSWAGLKRDALGVDAPAQMRMLAARLDAADSIEEVDAIRGDFDDLVITLMRHYGLRQADGAPDPAVWLSTFDGLIERRRQLIAVTSPRQEAQALAG